MVNLVGWLQFTMFAVQKQPALMRMDGARRAKVLATLAGLLILGVALMVLAWMAARATRRYMNRGERPPARPKPNVDDWATPLKDERNG